MKRRPVQFSRVGRYTFLASLFGLVCAAAIGAAESTPATATVVGTGNPLSSEPLDDDVIATRRKAAVESTELDEETKKKVVELYQLSESSLKVAKDAGARKAAFEKNTQDVARRVETVRQQLAKLKSRSPMQIDGSLPLADMEQMLTQLRQQVTDLKAELEKAETVLSSRAGRRKEIRALLLSLPERIDAAQRDFNAPAQSKEAPLLTLARHTEALARYRAAQAEVTQLQAELTLFDAEETVDYLRLQRDLLTQQLTATEADVKALDTAVQSRRTEAARQAVIETRRAIARTHPLLRSYARRNQELAKIIETVTADVAQTQSQLETAKQELETRRKQTTQVTDKVKLIGLTFAIGRMLRKELSELPDVSVQEKNVAQRRQKIDDIQLKLFDFNDERAVVADPQSIVSKVVASAATTHDFESERLADAAHAVLDDQRTYLDTVNRRYTELFDALVELDNTEQQLIRCVQDFESYINERILWIRSGKMLHREDWSLADLSESVLSRGHLNAAVGELLLDAENNLVLFGSALLLFGSLYYFRMRFRHELTVNGRSAERGSCCDYQVTFHAVFLTVVSAVLWPGLIVYIGWRLSVQEADNSASQAIATGLFSMVQVYFPLEILRIVCRSHGLGESHFHWPASATRVLRKNLGWLLVVGLPLVFITAALDAGDAQYGRDVLGRSCGVAKTLVLALFLRQVLHPTRGVFREYIEEHRGGWIDRLKYLWYGLGFLSPLTFAVLGYVGYDYTSRQLTQQLSTTLWWFLGLTFLRALLLRFVLVYRRRLSVQQAQQRRAALLASLRQGASDSATADPTATPPVSDELVDITQIGEQTHRIINAATVAAAFIIIWWTWADVLPALHMLDRWPLWNQVVRTTEEITDASGQTTTRVVEEMRGITIAHVAFAIFVIVITMIAARNIPGLLEITLLQRLPLDAAIRYAITTLASYAIILLGIIIAFGQIGVGWSQVQWLATALTFGLAFGLQEIFANFVAGLIILFERPIRVGDVVTVDDVTGSVSRIRIRATTITTWERKEFLVPNKEFLTGRLLNWTLSDQVNRIVIQIGIAYGSDTDLATEILYRVVKSHPSILTDPECRVTFDEFGDSALMFTIRAYLPNLDCRLQTVHELHLAIDKALREANIEIAFPQQDINIRSMPDPVAGTMASHSSVSRQTAASPDDLSETAT